VPVEHPNKIASLHVRPQAQDTASYLLKQIPDRGGKPSSLLQHEMLARSSVGQSATNRGMFASRPGSPQLTDVHPAPARQAARRPDQTDHI